MENLSQTSKEVFSLPRNATAGAGEPFNIAIQAVTNPPSIGSFDTIVAICQIPDGPLSEVINWVVKACPLGKINLFRKRVGAWNGFLRWEQEYTAWNDLRRRSPMDLSPQLVIDEFMAQIDSTNKQIVDWTSECAQRAESVQKEFSGVR